MKAITYHRYGAPDVVGLEEVPTPSPAEGEILVRVHAGVVTPSDGAARKGQPFIIRLSHRMVMVSNVVCDPLFPRNIKILPK